MKSAKPLPDTGLSPSRFFPAPTATTSDGMLCFGGRLSPEWLLDAYRHGIFPWPFHDADPIVWWSPDPRAILEFDRLHIPRRLDRTLRSGKFSVTGDRDFAAVIRNCAIGPGREDGTWITPAMIEAYEQMHLLGYAHSVEVWRDGELAGGIYGIAIGGLFAAESMFYHVRDASKVALVHLAAHLKSRGYRLFDIQQWTPHTARFGAIEIPRDDYLRRLASVIDLPITFGSGLQSNVSFPSAADS